jgi:isoquinoline 1-oxidoreductase subunit beta
MRRSRRHSSTFEVGASGLRGEARSSGERVSPKGRAHVEGEAPKNYLLSRRGLLVGTGVTGGLIVGGFIGRRPLVGQLAKIAVGPLLVNEGTPAGQVSGEAKPDIWFEVPPTGQILLYAPKAEMGQGIHTAIAQIACDELEITSEQIVVRHVDVVLGGGQHDGRGFGGLTATAASSSIRDVYGPLRSSAAMLREIVLLEAATQFGVSRKEVTVEKGAIFVTAKPDDKRAYGEVVAARKGDLGTWSTAPFDEFNAPILKDRTQFTSIGTSFPRVDALTKITGTAKYGYDALVPDMLFGAVVHPPRYDAKLVSADVAKAQGMRGVVKVVIEPENNLLAVVARTRSQAWAAANEIVGTWSEGSNASDASIEKALREASGGAVYEVGNVDSSLAGGSARNVIKAEYDIAAAAHAHLEPMSAVALVNRDEVHVWVGSQQPNQVASDVRAITGSRKVMVHGTYLGGGFGRRHTIHVAADAVRLSLAVGKPVHVGWSREQDQKFGPFRPPTIAQASGTVGANGKINALDLHLRSAALIDVPEALRDLVGFALVASNGAVLGYDIPNFRVMTHATDIGIPSGIWRGVGLLPNVFGLESFIDELAVAAGVDPVEFRLNNLSGDDLGKRAGILIRDVAERSGWGKPLPAGSGRGIATSMMAGSQVAAVVTVTVKDKVIRVDHVHVAADPGLVINPAGAKLQISGAVMMALGSSLNERISFADGMAVESNFDSYSILRPAQAPPVDIELIQSGDIPAGLGEPAIGPIAPALASAVFAATGQRLRSLPLQLA